MINRLLIEPNFDFLISSLKGRNLSCNESKYFFQKGKAIFKILLLYLALNEPSAHLLFQLLIMALSVSIFFCTM